MGSYPEEISPKDFMDIFHILEEIKALQGLASKLHVISAQECFALMAEVATLVAQSCQNETPLFPQANPEVISSGEISTYQWDVPMGSTERLPEGDIRNASPIRWGTVRDLDFRGTVNPLQGRPESHLYFRRKIQTDLRNFHKFFLRLAKACIVCQRGSHQGNPPDFPKFEDQIVPNRKSVQESNEVHVRTPIFSFSKKWKRNVRGYFVRKDRRKAQNLE
jgi:hypothetical protein